MTVAGKFGRKVYNTTTLWSKHENRETCYDVLINLTNDALGADEGTRIVFLSVDDRGVSFNATTSP